tara:strand:- start:132 stop:695 length:564 start_codon:yes stop_codon:yes gene_type:complete
MAPTPSAMIPIGTTAPDFELIDTVTGKMTSLDDVRGLRATLVMFICNHCPYVVHIKTGLAELGHDYDQSLMGIVAISSNDVEQYPQDGPDEMRDFAKETGFTFPYLYDETQGVAKSYDAACTPDFFLFNQDLVCAYRGRFDSSRPKIDNPAPVTGEDLRGAMDALLNGEQVVADQLPSMGCSIKWRS